MGFRDFGGYITDLLIAISLVGILRCSCGRVLPKLLLRPLIAIPPDPEVLDVKFHFGFAREG